MSCFATCFSTTFAVLGLKLLFGAREVTIGSVVLLACVSGAIASVWVGGTGEGVAAFVNTTVKGGVAGVLGPFENVVLRAVSRATGMDFPDMEHDSL